MICSNCGNENPAGAKFCTECATPMAVLCPSCGTSNPPGAKFCAECATSLSGAVSPSANRSAGSRISVASAVSAPVAGTSVAERRLVSVLFADLVGFTPFSEGRDAEEVRETLSRYFDLARQVIDRYGGTVEKFIGDAVMAVWGTPVAQEDDPERAVRAALELVEAVPTIGAGIQARCGVLTGEAAVTLGAQNQGMVAGDIVNTASRLQSAAAPGTVLVGEETRRAAAGIAFEPAGEQALKGKMLPVAAWRALRVVSERGGRNRSEALEAPFVGREEELRLIKDLFHATGRERKPRLISVVGPGGIGKTRLAWEFLKYVDGLAGRVLWHAGRSPAYGDGITFWALGEMVRGRAGLLESDDETTTREKIAASVQQHVPEAEERRWIESALLALLGLPAEIGSEQLFAAWRSFFEHLAAADPVVMVFEDLHHADTGLLDFIDQLMEWSRNAPIIVITLARPELLEKRPEWGAGARTFTSIHLDPLSNDSMRQLLAGLVPGLPAPATERIVERADGIPLYAVETVRMLLANGQLVLEDGGYRPVGELADLAVPQTLTALIAARLDALDPSDRALLGDAAVLGQSFAIAGLSAVSGVTPDDLAPRLRDLVRRELLTLDADPRSPERGQYAFVQSLIREVAYNTLAKNDRKSRHLAAARYFESLETDEVAGGLAGHYLAAHRLANDAAEAAALATQARLALRGAAERAAALGSHEQAVSLLEQAIEVAVDPTDRAELHERAKASAEQGLVDATVERHALGALEAWREVGDRRAIARATADYTWTVALRLRDPDRAAPMALAAWEEFSDLEGTPEGVWLMTAVAAALQHVGREEEGLGMIERYLPAAERLDLVQPFVIGLERKASAMSGRPRETLILLRGAHQLAEAAGLRSEERSGRTSLTFLAQWDDPVGGLALAREGLEIAGRIGSRGYGFTMVGNGTVCALRAGEWDWAEALLDEWLSFERAMDAYMEFFVDRAVLGSLRGRDPSADLEEATRLRESMTDPQYAAYDHWGRAWAALASGAHADARSEAEQAARGYRWFVPLGLPVAARAALWEGDAIGAAEILDSLDASGHRGGALDLDRATLRAGIVALEGRGAEALAGYREALHGWRKLGLAFDEALAVTDMATLLPAPERASVEVRAAVEGALSTLERLRAKPMLERLATAPVGPPAEAKRRSAERSATVAQSPS